jgi:hypothetical protein
MKRRFQSASLIALAFTLLAGPTGALPICWAPGSAIPAMVMEDSGMFMDAPMVLPQLAPWSAPCCNLYATIPPAALLPPGQALSSAKLASTADAMVQQILPLLRMSFAPTRPRKDTSPLQPVLCVFLI